MVALTCQQNEKKKKATNMGSGMVQRKVQCWHISKSITRTS